MAMIGAGQEARALEGVVLLSYSSLCVLRLGPSGKKASVLQHLTSASPEACLALTRDHNEAVALFLHFTPCRKQI